VVRGECVDAQWVVVVAAVPHDCAIVHSFVIVRERRTRGSPASNHPAIVEFRRAANRVRMRHAYRTAHRPRSGLGARRRSRLQPLAVTSQMHGRIMLIAIACSLSACGQSSGGPTPATNPGTIVNGKVAPDANGNNRDQPISTSPSP
jgi:hypothetical protein